MIGNSRTSPLCWTRLTLSTMSSWSEDNTMEMMHRRTLITFAIQTWNATHSHIITILVHTAVCRRRQMLMMQLNVVLGLTFAVFSSSRMRVIDHNWSATRQRLHLQSVAKISCHSVLSGDRIRQCEDIIWVSPQGHRSVSASRHFLLQALQCPCFVRKRFSRDHCCRGRSKPGCRIVGSHTRW